MNLGKMKMHFSANKTKYMMAASIIGVVASAALSFRAGYKTNDILKEEDTKTQKAKKLAPVVAPAVAAVGVTTALIFKNQSTNNAEKAVLAAALAASQEKASMYANAKEIQDVNEEEIDHDTTYTWIEGVLGCEWKATYSDILEGLLHVNEMFAKIGSIDYNEFLLAAGAGQTDVAEDFLWDCDRFAEDGMEYFIDWYIKDVEIQDDEGNYRTVKMLEFPYSPVHKSVIEFEYERGCYYSHP